MRKVVSATSLPSRIRCAIYTRKSIEVEADEQVNSLQTQREVCSAFIRCHEHLNWFEVPGRYDDSGRSGSTLERPALRKLISDIEAGEIEIVLFYKIDRLTRSLADLTSSAIAWSAGHPKPDYNRRRGNHQ